MLKGLVIKATANRYTINCEGRIYNCSLGGALKYQSTGEEIKNRNIAACGDFVMFNPEGEDEGQVAQVCQRKNLFSRFMQRAKERHLLAANIDQVMVINTIFHPNFSSKILDGISIATQSQEIGLIAVFNKMDLVEKLKESHKNKEKFKKIIDTYKRAGHEILLTSTKNNESIENIKQHLKDKTTMLCGLSGVGKSSILKLIEPTWTIKIGEISKKYKQGRHTTVLSELKELSFGGRIIDSPGLRSFVPVDIMKEDLQHYFFEFKEYFKKCKFYNCSHMHEPGCQVLNALEEGAISAERYASYGYFWGIINEHKNFDLRKMQK